jgi:AAA domain
MCLSAIANQKGGVGKTTMTLGLSSEIARLGSRVLVIDLDPQASGTKVLAADVEERQTVADVMLEPERRTPATSTESRGGARPAARPCPHLRRRRRGVGRMVDRFTEGISGPVNASAPNPVTNKTFSKLLGKVLKRPAFFPAPKFAVTFRFPELEPALRDLLGR